MTQSSIYERIVASFDKQSGLRATPVTFAIIWLNCLIFAVELLLSKDTGAILGVPQRPLLLLGANYACATVANLRWDTLITSCFLHGSVLHIGFNMMALRNVGPFVERTAGSARMAWMYLVAGIGGSIASSLVGWYAAPERLSVGASGAICGVLAAAVVIGWRAHGIGSPISQSIGKWLVITLLLGLAPGFDNAAHVGGAVAGAAAAALWRRGFAYSSKAIVTTWLVCAVVVTGAFASVFIHDKTDPTASLFFPERLQRAIDFARHGDCEKAYEALATARHLIPHDDRLAPVTDAIDAKCGRPEGSIY